MAKGLEARIAAEPGWELLAPVPFSTVCFRHVPDGLDAGALDVHNEAILDEVNTSGEIFLSHTKLCDRYTIRVTIGNPRTTQAHVDRCWELLQGATTTFVRR